MMEEQKSLEQWALDIRSNKQMWVAFYEEFLGTRPTSIQRLFRAANLYGFWPLFESIIDSSGRGLTGDPLNYVLKVASIKFKESQEVINAEVDYKNAIEQSKKATAKANQALEKRATRKRK